MKNYLTIIHKSDFMDFFKFGYLFIDGKRAVEFDGNIGGLRNNTDLRDAVFERCNQFDYSFSILLVHFRNNHFADGKLYIKEVRNVFALDADAKRELEISCDPRIVINDPVWPDAMRILQERFLYENARKGVQNIWQILKIKQPISDFESILPDKDIKEIVYEVQNDKRPTGALSFWVYLLRYERHAFFPKDATGFFRDIINVFTNTFKEKELSAEIIETTDIYKLLIRLEDKNFKVKELIDELEKTEEGSRFFSKLDEQAMHTATIKIALLFLIFKHMFNSGFNISKDEALKRYSEFFPEAYYFALYLLGVYLGNSHTFECLYDTMPLPIFTQISEREQNEQLEQYVDVTQDYIVRGSQVNLFEDTRSVETCQELNTGKVCSEDMHVACTVSTSSPDNEEDSSIYSSVNTMIVQSFEQRVDAISNLISKNYNYIEIAENLRCLLCEARREKKITQKKFAELFGIHQNDISGYFRLLNLPDEIQKKEKSKPCVPFDELRKISGRRKSPEEKVNYYNELRSKYEVNGEEEKKYNAESST